MMKLENAGPQMLESRQSIVSQFLPNTEGLELIPIIAMGSNI